MTETIRVGILGAGWAGESHAIAFSQLPHVEVTALWSRTRTSAEMLAQQLNQSGLRVYNNWQDLIEQAGVDVISVATPPMLRRKPILMAYKKKDFLRQLTRSCLQLTSSASLQQLFVSTDRQVYFCFTP